MNGMENFEFILPYRFLHIFLCPTLNFSSNLCGHGGDVEENTGLLVKEVGGHSVGHVAAHPVAGVKT